MLSKGLQRSSAILQQIISILIISVQLQSVFMSASNSECRTVMFLFLHYKYYVMYGDVP